MRTQTYDHTILLAHGSRDPQWSAPFRNLIDKLRHGNLHLSLAFMELCEPSLEDVILAAHERGDRSIAILPLFFSAGRHLREDVPEQLSAIQKDLPVSLTLLPAIGEQSAFVDFIESLVLELTASH